MEGGAQDSRVVQKRLRLAKVIQWTIGIVWSCVFAVDFDRVLLSLTGNRTCLPSLGIVFWILLAAVPLMRLLTTTRTTIAVLVTSIFLMLPLYAMVTVLDVHQSICLFKCDRGDEVACIDYFLIAPSEKRFIALEKSCGRGYMTACSIWMDEIERMDEIEMTSSISVPCGSIDKLCDPRIWRCGHLYERCCTLRYTEACRGRDGLLNEK